MIKNNLYYNMKDLQEGFVINGVINVIMVDFCK